MERIEVRELREHASRYLERVKAGETVEVTERGELVALLVPPSAAVSARDRLVADGRLLPGAGPLRPPRRAPGTTSSGDVLAEVRADR